MTSIPFLLRVEGVVDRLKGFLDAGESSSDVVGALLSPRRRAAAASSGLSVGTR